jgi:hypothetical protein
MAHADYSCCAICDSKMNYGEDATKEDICVSCIEDLLAIDLKITRVSSLMDHIDALSDADALAFLHRIGFIPCFYQNDIDQRLIDRGLITTNGGPKWGRGLKPIETS